MEKYEKNIIVVEPTLITVGYLCDAIKNLGYHPVILCKKSNYTGDSIKHLERFPYHDIDTGNFLEVLAFIQQNNLANSMGVITTADRFLPLACKISSALDILGPDPVVLSLNDKADVCSLIPEYSPPFLSFSSNSIPIPELSHMAKLYDSVIIKPTRSAGGKGMFIADGDSIKNINEIIYQESSRLNIAPDWIAQAQIKGKLASLEGYVSDGKVIALGISLREKVGRAEAVNKFPANNDIDQVISKRMLDAVTNLSTRSGFKNGYFHSEFIIGKDNCYMIDANFGRLAGAGVGIQIGLSYDKQPIQTYMHMVDLSLCGLKHLGHNFFRKKNLTETLAIHYGLKQSAFVQDIHLPPNMSDLFHYQFLDLNQTISSLSTGNSAIIATIVGSPERVMYGMANTKIATNHGLLAAYFQE